MTGNAYMRRRIEGLERDPRFRPPPERSEAYLRIREFTNRYKEARSSGGVTGEMEEAAEQIRTGIRARLGRTGARTGAPGEGRR